MQCHCADILDEVFSGYQEDPKFQLKETSLQFDVNGKGNLMHLS